MRALAFLLGSIILLALPSGALAIQKSSGAASNIRRNPDVEKVKPLDETRRVAAKYADCVVRKKPAKAALAVLDLVPNKAIIKNYKDLIDRDCFLKASRTAFEARLRFPNDHLRYALADALVRKEFPTAPAMDVVNIAPLWHEQFDAAAYLPPPGKKRSAKKQALWNEYALETQASIFISKFGECVVRANQKQTHALLLTEPASDAERAVLKNLAPVLGDCLPAGQSFRANQSMIRGTIAINYYRLAKAPRVAAAVTK